MKRLSLRTLFLPLALAFGAAPILLTGCTEPEADVEVAPDVESDPDTEPEVDVEVQEE